MQVKPRRPTGVTILGVLAILGAIALLFSGVVLIALGLVIGTYAGSQLTNSLATAGYSGLASLGAGTIAAIVTALGAGLLILGILYFAFGVGFFGGKGWAWTLGIIVVSIGIILNIIQIALGSIGSVFGLIIGLLIVYYLTRPHVKTFFGKGPAVATPVTSPGSGMANPAMPTSMAGSIRCSNCGASVPTGSTKCPSCGAPL